MKKGKLLFLLIAVLSLALLLVACGDKEEPEDPADTTESVESSDQNGETQQDVKHEMHDYFDFSEEEAEVFTKVTQLKGEIVSHDSENNLIALKTQDLNVKNEVVDTVTVYNYVTDEEIAKYEASNLLYADREDIKAELDVKIDYPIIQVTKTSYSEDSLKKVYDISYYFAKKDGGLIRQTDKPNYEKHEFYNGLVAIDMGDEMVWIDRNMEIVRTAASVAANGYDVDFYNCEYQGYLYTWSDLHLQVFNLDGLCSGEYMIEHDGELNVHVLDNGKVLIQDIEYVDEYTECEFKLSNENLLSTEIYRCVMKSYVMNYVDGTLEEVDLDYIVNDLGTRYGERYGAGNFFPFALAAGRENQAMIYRIANGSVAVDPEYVVLSNDLKIEYTVKNTTAGRDYYSATLLNDKLYAMNVYEGGAYQGYIFDLDGNAIAPISREAWYEYGDWYLGDWMDGYWDENDNWVDHGHWSYGELREGYYDDNHVWIVDPTRENFYYGTWISGHYDEDGVWVDGHFSYADWQIYDSGWEIQEQVTDSYIVTEHAVYDYNMNVVYDMTDGAFDDVFVDENLNRIYFVKHNFKTGADEYYLFDEETKTPVLWIDEFGVIVQGYDGGYYTYKLEERMYEMYNANDELLLKTHYNIHPYFTIDSEDALVVSADFNGNAIVFIVK